MKVRRNSKAHTALLWVFVTWWSVPATWLFLAPLFWLLDGDWPEVRDGLGNFSWWLAGFGGAAAQED